MKRGMDKDEAVGESRRTNIQNLSGYSLCDSQGNFDALHTHTKDVDAELKS